MKERTIHFGPAGTLIGTITSPEIEQLSGHRRAVLLTNAGIIPRVGPHRINVTLARRAAAQGLHAFRFDMAGLGDSQQRTPEGSLLKQRIADIRSAMDQMQRTLRIEHFTMIGFCSGADLAHLTALEDDRLDAIVMFDPYLYRTPRAALSHFLRQAKLKGWPHALALATGSLLHPKQTLGESDSMNAGMTQGRSIFPSRDEFASRLKALLERNVRILLIFSGGNPTLYNYARQFQDGFRRYGSVGKISNTFLPNCDHTITTLSARAAVLDLVLPWLRHSNAALTANEPLTEALG